MPGALTESPGNEHVHQSGPPSPQAHERESGRPVRAGVHARRADAGCARRRADPAPCRRSAPGGWRSCLDRRGSRRRRPGPDLRQRGRRCGSSRSPADTLAGQAPDVPGHGPFRHGCPESWVSSPIRACLSHLVESRSPWTMDGFGFARSRTPGGPRRRRDAGRARRDGEEPPRINGIGRICRIRTTVAGSTRRSARGTTAGGG